VVDAFIHAHELPASAWPSQRVVNLPGITATVEQMVAALKRAGGAQAAERVRWKPDARIQAIVRTWPVRFRTPRALEMGFRADPDVEAVIRDYAADEGVKLA
jgi:nucleoside-diphosphate-sugar epimerase